ncbi:MAG TPA: hypothetical protein VM120_07390 [Bryobacteraceae bacterium]|nr:hypothetical protein [Bryobacteraceae bacterium]
MTISRRLSLLSALGFVACTNPGDKLEILPMTIGEWRRKAVENIPVEEYPEDLKRLGVKRARRGIYQAANRVTASIYEFAVPAVAFELVQKWRPQPRKIVFDKGAYFVQLESDRDDNASLNMFAAALERGLK